MPAPHPDLKKRDPDLTVRMLRLAWAYWPGCLRVAGLQIALLILGLIGLSFMGLGIDYLRYILQPAAAATGLPVVAKPPLWPLGFIPPAAWSPMQVLAVLAGCIFGLALLRAVLNFAYIYALSGLMDGQLVRDLRYRVYNRMQRLSFRFFDANATGTLINRVTGDVLAVRAFIDGVLVQSLILVLSLAVYAVYMTRINLPLTLACLAPTPMIWLLTRMFARRVQPAYLENRRLFDQLLVLLSENIRGAHVVKGFARQVQEIGKFTRAGQTLREQKLSIFRHVAFYQPLIGMVTHLGLTILIGYGGYLVIRFEQAPDVLSAARAGISVGQLLVFTGLLQQFSGQVANIANISNSMQQSLAGAKRVFEVLDAPIEIRSPEIPEPLPASRADLDFEQVSFAYEPEHPVLSDINFRIPSGSCVAILGATGSGKTTLMSLVPRFYDPTGGRILLNGVDLRQADVEEVRRRIGMVFQESFLFSNTVAANIAFGHPDATKEQIVQAAQTAAAHEFIMEMPAGYETMLHEGGSNLSGGQRQRLALARALLLNPPLLLLDDPTAAVDPETEHEILEALDHAMQGRTTLIVAHRLSTLRRADLVLVLENGRLVQTGTHAELVQSPGFYRLVAELQSTPEDVAVLLNRWQQGLE